MRRSLLIISAAILPILTGCASTVRTPSKETESKEVVAKTVEAQSVEYSSNTKDKLTFLDTLNRGKELFLSENDVAVLNVSANTSPSPAVSAVTNTNTGRGSVSQVKTAEVSEPFFRIQVLASSQIDMVRQEKRNAEVSTGLPVFMSSEQSLYKLYVGEFQTREQAEAALPNIKKKGYQDAWIVKK